MENYIEVNVSKDGLHLFATAPKSIKNDEKLNVVINILLSKFPKSEGYKISYTKWKAEGTHTEVVN
ncbi:hypothetical protein AAXB25_14845 [Paenibacillus lautus]|uniref:hypothetical protein n=1 Tax=Paenibacillus lautus TaxID=1401 RepID=UPI003D2B4A0D